MRIIKSFLARTSKTVAAMVLVKRINSGLCFKISAFVIVFSMMCHAHSSQGNLILDKQCVTRSENSANTVEFVEQVLLNVQESDRLGNPSCINLTKPVHNMYLSIQTPLKSNDSCRN